MKERPILFNGEMVRAILEGRKTQTRRVVKPAISDITPVKPALTGGPMVDTTQLTAYDENGHLTHRRCPYGQSGDRLWVRETHHVPGDYLNADLVDEIRSGISTPDSLGVTYRADAPAMTPSDGGWTPSIHMPRWASRITLEIVSVRVERLQEISAGDVKAEGVRNQIDADGNWLIDVSSKHSPAKFLNQLYVDSDSMLRAHFASLWESINGAGSWEASPWVWVVEFRRVEA